MKTEAFPTLIYRYHLDDTEQVKARVEEYYKEYKFQNNAPDQWNCDLFTSYGSGTFPIGECLDAFTPVLDEFQTESKSYGSMILTDLWLNVYETQQWQEKHIHSPGQWSGVYYVHFDPNEHKATSFYNPIETLLASNGIKQHWPYRDDWRKRWLNYDWHDWPTRRNSLRYRHHATGCVTRKGVHV